MKGNEEMEVSLNGVDWVAISRFKDSDGTYTLPPGNPVYVRGTLRADNPVVLNGLGTIRQIDSAKPPFRKVRPDPPFWSAYK